MDPVLLKPTDLDLHYFKRGYAIFLKRLCPQYSHFFSHTRSGFPLLFFCFSVDPWHHCSVRSLFHVFPI